MPGRVSVSLLAGIPIPPETPGQRLCVRVFAVPWLVSESRMAATEDNATPTAPAEGTRCFLLERPNRYDGTIHLGKKKDTCNSHIPPNFLGCDEWSSLGEAARGSCWRGSSAPEQGTDTTPGSVLGPRRTGRSSALKRAKILHLRRKKEKENKTYTKATWKGVGWKILKEEKLLLRCQRLVKDIGNSESYSSQLPSLCTMHIHLHCWQVFSYLKHGNRVLPVMGKSVNTTPLGSNARISTSKFRTIPFLSIQSMNLWMNKDVLLLSLDLTL